MTIGIGNPPVTADAAQLAQLRTDLGLASQAEAEAGAENTKVMTPLRVSQAIDAQAPAGGFTVASQAEAEAGTENTKGMTPLRVYQAILALASASLTFVETKTSSDHCKTEPGDPGAFLSVFCVSNPGSSAKISIYDGASAAGGNPIGIGTYPASSNGAVIATGAYLNMGAAVSCPNGIWIEISGTGTYIIIIQ